MAHISNIRIRIESNQNDFMKSIIIIQAVLDNNFFHYFGNAIKIIIMILLCRISTHYRPCFTNWICKWNRNVLCNKIDNLPPGDWWLVSIIVFIISWKYSSTAWNHLCWWTIIIFQIVWKLKEKKYGIKSVSISNVRHIIYHHHHHWISGNG